MHAHRPALGFAEQYATPVDAEVGTFFPRRNEFGALSYLRWGRLRFDVRVGTEANLKVVIKVGRAGDVCEHYLVETDVAHVERGSHQRVTQDFFLHPESAHLGPATSVRFSYILHLHGASIPSEHDYLLLDGERLVHEHAPVRIATSRTMGANLYRTHEVDRAVLQRDVDWYNNHLDSLNIVPKFTKGTPTHPYHPKRAIHDLIDKVVRMQRERPAKPQAIKVCVDCIDDTDFITHLIFARENGVRVQCLVDWRKMMLNDGDNYARLVRSSVELVGIFCMQRHPLIEVATDMHTKFIIFGDEDCIEGSFNIGFDRWWANWESGMQFHSEGVCRILDNVFQSIRGGIIQPYGVDPLSSFNLLYTFGVQTILNGKLYRPHHAILSEINRARHSIRVCAFTIGELQGEHGDSVVDALIRAQRRGVDVRIIVNGHVVRQGDSGRECSMAEELRRPLIPAIARLLGSGVPVALAYGQIDQRVPYSPIHSKYCVIDDALVLEGSFNWYNTSVYSHDLLMVAASPPLARSFAHEFNQILRLFRFPAGVGGTPYSVVPPFDQPAGGPSSHAPMLELAGR